MGLQCKLDKDVSDEENLVLVDIIFVDCLKSRNHLRQRMPPDYSNDELVDPEAESKMDQSEVDGSADRGHDKMHQHWSFIVIL